MKMLQLMKIRVNKQTYFHIENNLRRQISALYITGDKANENYITLHPYLSFEETFKDKIALESSILERKLHINLAEVLNKYAKYTEICVKLNELENERESLSQQLKDLIKKKDAANDSKSNALKTAGKNVRNEWKKLRECLYSVEDDFAHAYLNLPNILHAHPTQTIYTHEAQQIKQQQQKDVENWQFIDENRYYLLGDAANFDLRSMQCLQQYFVHNGKFTPTANPDFVRCVLLEGNATPLKNYQQVVEHNLQNKINVAYLTGGGAFESFLGAITKLSVYPTLLPLRWISCGRSYQKSTRFGDKSSFYNVTQTNAVQIFVATMTDKEADYQMENTLNLLTNFYKTLNLPFRVVYNKASELSLSECQRASIETYSESLKCHIPLGYISNYSNFVSKRILFNVREKDQYYFPHLLGGPILYTSRLIAALNEYKIPLSSCSLLGDTNINANENDIKAFN